VKYDEKHAAVQRLYLGNTGGDAQQFKLENLFLDLHYHTLNMAQEKLQRELSRISDELSSGSIKPNHGSSHIFKVVTG
jgi:hypothetical protein